MGRGANWEDKLEKEDDAVAEELTIDNIEEAAEAINDLEDYGVEMDYGENLAQLTLTQYGREIGTVTVDQDGIFDIRIYRRKGSFKRAFRDAGYELE